MDLHPIKSFQLFVVQIEYSGNITRSQQAYFALGLTTDDGQYEVMVKEACNDVPRR